MTSPQPSAAGSVRNRFEVLQEASSGSGTPWTRTHRWFIVEENSNGWYVGSSFLTKRQVKRRRRTLIRDFGCVEVRVVQGGDLFMVVDSNSRRLGGAYASESECRRAHNLMDFRAMGRYAPEERKSSRFVRMLHDDVV